MASINTPGENAAAAALSWLWPRSDTHNDEHISAGFAAVLDRHDFDVTAEADNYDAEPRAACVTNIDWSGATTEEIEREDSETVTFRVKVPATVKFTTRFDFPETGRSADGEPTLGFKILETKRTFVFPLLVTIGLIAGRFGEPDIRAVEVKRPPLTALYGPIDPFQDYEDRRT